MVSVLKVLQYQKRLCKCTFYFKATIGEWISFTKKIDHAGHFELFTQLDER